jgi:hypothetical protein
MSYSTAKKKDDTFPGGKDLLRSKDLSSLADKEHSIQPVKLQSLCSKLSLSSCQNLGDQDKQTGNEGSKESEMLSLKLEEVKHIQRVLSNARIEVSYCLSFLLLILYLHCE